MVQGVVKDVYDDKFQKEFKIFGLANCKQAIYNSDDLKIAYVNKLAVFVSQDSYRFMFFNVHNKYMLNIPISNETKVLKAEEMAD